MQGLPPIPTQTTKNDSKTISFPQIPIRMRNGGTDYMRNNIRGNLC